MKTLRAGLARLGGLFTRTSRERDLDEELASHLALHMDDNLRRGMTPEDARRAAYLRLGGVELVKESVREQRGFPAIEAFLRDIRYSLRGLRRDRTYVLTAIVTLALAIGLNVTVFAIMNTMLFRGYPLVQRNDRLVYIQEQYPSAGAVSLTSISRIGAPRRTLSTGWRSWGKRISASRTGRDIPSIAAPSP